MKRHAFRFLLPTSYFLLLAILLLASFLRFYRLDAQSFWNDEGNSARIAERTLDLILEGAEGDIHPPGYYLLLHYWRALFGQSEFALRSLSVVAGLALVALTYLLGRHLFGEATGLTAAFLGAISPFAIYYSQEARMYALLTALSAAATYLLLCLLAVAARQKPGFSEKTWFLAYVFTSAAGLYTHYAFAFVLLVHNAIFGLWWLAVARRSAHRASGCVRWRRLMLWAGVQAAVVVLYLPWLPVALRSVIGRPAAGQAYELGPALLTALLDLLRILSVGTTLPLGEATAALVGTGLLLLVGLWPALPLPSATKESPAASTVCSTGVRLEVPHRADLAGWSGVASVALYLLLPVALIFTLDLYKPAWLKFLVVVLPPFHILVAHGVENLARIAGSKRQETRCKKQEAKGILHHAPSILYPAPLVLLTVLSAIAVYPSLQNLYFNPAYARDDYRQIAADVAAFARPGDGIILNAPNQWEVFTYYYPDQDVYPAPYQPDATETETFLTPLTKQYRRLLVLYWGDAESDPWRLVETWLAAHAYKANDNWYGRVRLATYGVASLPEEPAVALDARFGKSIRLRGYSLAPAPPVHGIPALPVHGIPAPPVHGIPAPPVHGIPAPPVHGIPAPPVHGIPAPPVHGGAPGDILPVTLFWEAQTPIAERYKVTVQLLDDAGQLVAQHDTEPGDSLAPTTIWDPGQVLADRYGVLLPADLPPGRYTLIVGVYHVATGERLPVALGSESVGDHLPLCDISVEPLNHESRERTRR